MMNPHNSPKIDLLCFDENLFPQHIRNFSITNKKYPSITFIGYIRVPRGDNYIVSISYFQFDSCRRSGNISGVVLGRKGLCRIAADFATKTLMPSPTGTTAKESDAGFTNHLGDYYTKS